MAGGTSQKGDGAGERDSVSADHSRQTTPPSPRCGGCCRGWRRCKDGDWLYQLRCRPTRCSSNTPMSRVSRKAALSCVTRSSSREPFHVHRISRGHPLVWRMETCGTQNTVTGGMSTSWSVQRRRSRGAGKPGALQRYPHRPWQQYVQHHARIALLHAHCDDRVHEHAEPAEALLHPKEPPSPPRLSPSMVLTTAQAHYTSAHTADAEPRGTSPRGGDLSSAAPGRTCRRWF